MAPIGHTSPRGGGVVNVADLLLRAGAVAVLSTLVPVDVTHNAQTMSRFFRYLAHAIADKSTPPGTSVLDVWHKVQALNVVVDIRERQSAELGIFPRTRIESDRAVHE
jgi:hypothetical protein